jgi:methionine synthase I (cobalamin-dependent)
MQPEKITKLHQDFVDAGADIILTNSFGGTRHRLKLHDAQDRVFELNKKAAELARAVADKAGRKVIVAGSVGPTGELLVPLGALTFEDAVEAFKEQIEGLKAGGADVAWIETMSSPEEIRAAAQGARSGRHALHLHRFVRYGRQDDDGAFAEGHFRCRRPSVCRNSRWRWAPIAASARPTSCRRCST